jgi:hypothetical protein
MVRQVTTADEPPTRAETGVKAVLRAIPYIGSSLSIIFEDTRARHVARGTGVVQEIAEETGADRLSERLAKDEEVEVLFIEGVEIAVRSGLKAKRRLLARVVAKAVLDDAEIEPGQLLVQAFRDLDAPQLRALTRIRNAEDAAKAVEVDGETNDVRSDRIADAASKTGRAEPTPVLAALIRTGVVYPATLVGGGVAAYGVSENERRRPHLQQRRWSVIVWAEPFNLVGRPKLTSDFTEVHVDTFAHELILFKLV